MRANESDETSEWDELPTDGADAWFGMLLVVLSGGFGIKALLWTGGMVSRLF